MRVRIYKDQQDYVGTIVDVKKIRYVNGRGTIETNLGNIIECPARYVIEDACNVKQWFMSEIEIFGAD